MRIKKKLDRNNIENIMSLTSLQLGMLYHYISSENISEYHEQLCLTISGDLNLELFQNAWDLVVEDNEMLRTIFKWEGIDNPVQIVLKKYPIPIHFIDISQQLDKDDALEKVKIEDLNSKIDIAEETLRIYLIKLDSQKYKLIVSNNHILYDGWSTGIIYKELMNNYTCLYKKQVINREKKEKFSKFIKYTQNLDKVKEREYWSNHLFKKNIRDDYFAYNGSSHFEEYLHVINKDKSYKIKNFAKINKVSLAAVLYGCWSVLVQKLSDSNEIVFGTTVSGRPESLHSIENMVGLFINTIPLQIIVDDNINFIDLIYKIDETMHARKEFENTSLVDIKEYCGIETNENLFNSIVIIENYPLDVDINKNNVLAIENFEIVEKTNYNLALEILTFNELQLKFNYNYDCINKKIIEKIGYYFEKILKLLLENEKIEMKNFDLLENDEEKQISDKFNYAKADFIKDKTLNDLFESQVNKTPDNVAVVFQDEKITYKNLNEKSNQLARILREKGVKPNSVIGIMANQSVELIIGILGIVKSGGAYLFINKLDSKENIEYTLSDSGCKILLVTGKLLYDLDFKGDEIDLFKKNIFEGDSSNLVKVNKPHDLVLINYNTNRLSSIIGTMFEHRNITIFFEQDDMIYEQGDNVIQYRPLIHESSIFEIWGALLNGIKLYLANEEVCSPRLLETMVKNYKITVLWLTTDLFHHLTDNMIDVFANIRYLFIKQEGFVLPEYINTVKKRYEYITIVLCYGSLEYSTFSINYVVEKEINSHQIIGKPNINMNAYVINKTNNLVPFGFCGDLYISGRGLARGYKGKPGLTDEKFIRNPYKFGQKMFKTGERARWTHDGNLELVGKTREHLYTENKQLVITATFTVEPIGKYLKWWCMQFQQKVTLKFAPYNQVFQQLTDKTSLVSKNNGINIVLVRFEDWIREVKSEKEQLSTLEENFKDFIKILQHQREDTYYLIGVFPISTHLGLGIKVTEQIKELNKEMGEYFRDKEKFYLLDLSGLDKLYGIDEVFDPIKDKEGHISFTDEYYAAMGTNIARKVCAIQSPPPFKVIVLDCDNTLWEGVCGEVGPFNVKINNSYKDLQNFLIQKQKDGMLLALCSKNNEKDVLDVFEKNSEMQLKMEHLATWKINWNNKWENIKQLAEELNLGLESFIFIDDSSFECSQLMIHCPEVLTLKLPEDSESIAMYMKHIWAFDKEQVTIEDKNRTKMYLAQKQREDFRKDSISVEDFLQSLHIEMSINQLEEKEIIRASQLTQKTNQFNSSSIRRTEVDLTNFMKEENHRCWGVKVKDRFGEYGLVGLILAVQKRKILLIETFLLSCRVLGKKIEHAIMMGIYRYCKEEDLSRVLIKIKKTLKNQPFIQFIEEGFWYKVEESEQYVTYELEVDSIHSTIEYVQIYYNCNYDSDINEEPVPVDSCQVNLIHESKNGSNNKYDTWKVEIENREKLVYLNYLLALEYHTGNKLLELLVNEELSNRSIIQAKYEAPINEIEEKLAVLWSKLLNVDRVGRNDNFFDLGGNSLSGVSLASRIHKEFNVEVNLVLILKTPILKTVAENISNSKTNVFSSIKQVEESSEYTASTAQKRMYALNQFNKNSVIYNITDVMKVSGELNRDKIYEIFCSLIDRHDSFRTYFEMKDGEVVQKIKKTIDFILEYEELDEANDCLIKENVRRFVRPFDLSKAPLLRVKLLKLEEKKYILIVDMHHIISDGTSMRILMMEFTKMYKGEKLE